MRLPKKFTILSLFLLILVVSIPLAYYVAKRDHWNALATLESNGVVITYRRPEPSALDKWLGVYRFDSLKKVSQPLSPPPPTFDASGLIARLHNLQEYFDSQIHCADESYSFLLPHAKTLKVLEIERLPPKPAEFFGNFTALEQLVSEVPIDLSWFPNSEKITELEFVTAVPTNVNSCSNLTKLTVHGIGGMSPMNDDIDVKQIADLESLISLTLRDLTSLKDIGPLKSLANLKHLDVSRTSVVDYSVVADLKGLRHLTANQNEFRIAPKFSAGSKIESIDLRSSSVRDPKCFRNLDHLRFLAFDGFPERAISLSELGDLPALETLIILRARISNAEVGKLPGIATIIFADCEVSPQIQTDLESALPPSTIVVESNVSNPRQD